MAQFRWRLAETIAWCGPRAAPHDAARCLRTALLCPRLAGFDAAQPTMYEWLRAPDAFDEVDRLARARTRELRSAGQQPSRPAADLAGGRLLVATPYLHLWDGASEAASGGFIDAQDGAPWDTWVALVPRERAGPGYAGDPYLLAWVPPAFVDAADAAVEVNAFGSLAWAGHERDAFQESLRLAGLL